jgi:hypothetical protein
MMADLDSAQAGRTRRQLFERFCNASTVVCTAHCPSPLTARVTRWRMVFGSSPREAFRKRTINREYNRRGAHSVLPRPR